MKTILTLLAVLGLAPGAFAREIVLSVDGLVCAYCANGIAATAGRDPAIAKVTVDLDNALTRFSLKSGATLSADDAKKLIVRAGYQVADVTVTDQSTEANRFRLATLAGGALPSEVTSAYLAESKTADGRTRLHVRLTLERPFAAAWLPADATTANGFTNTPADIPLGWTPGQAEVRSTRQLFPGHETRIALAQPDDHTTVIYLEIDA